MARLNPVRGSSETRFARYCVPGDPAECWVWSGPIEANGYGVIKQNGRAQMAHRYSYERAVGPIPAGLYIDHLCRTRACVNPDHMEPVTNGENVLRGEGPAARNARKTHCDHGHELSAPNVYNPPKRPHVRVCRACARLRTAEHNSKRKAAA